MNSQTDHSRAFAEDPGLQLVRARFRNGDAFLAAYQTNLPNGGLFIATRNSPPLAAAIVVEVRLPELRDHVYLRGTVAWRRPGRSRAMGDGPSSPGSTKVRAGFGVEFVAADRRKLEFLLGVARGEIVEMAPRRHRRLPIAVDVEWRAKDARHRFSSTVEDIGEGGAFIRTTEFFPIGSAVLLDLRPPGALASVLIEGRVAWTRHTSGEEGMGVEFRCRDRGGARRLRELVRRIEQDCYSDAAGA
ncbi:MAG: PilZ domain-containing protein [Deltaproteobacteria bacterium]|nr:PilZ domain-containing protein [Deltaproteobacteria bacterium]